VNEVVSKTLFDREVANLQRLAALRDWTIHRAEFPIIDVGFADESRLPLRIRMVAAAWNDLPPSVELLAPDGAFLPCGTSKLLPGGVLNPGPHRFTGRPFVCMVGTKEYHTHENHVGDSWDNYRRRDGMSLLYILSQIWEAWLRTKK
jgi:hypothetical protein